MRVLPIFQINTLYETDTLIVAVRFGIAFIAAIFAAGFTGLYTSMTKQVRAPTVLAFVVFVAFFATMATATLSSSTLVWGYPVLMGWGLGTTITTLLTAAQLSIPQDLIALASGIMISFRSLGGTIGISICKRPSRPLFFFFFSRIRVSRKKEKKQMGKAKTGKQG